MLKNGITLITSCGKAITNYRRKQSCETSKKDQLFAQNSYIINKNFYCHLKTSEHRGDVNELAPVRQI